ncbi:hypothetical protein MAPG_03547 [Magnaporthiopsis poae ATCC 64411]|uniref:Uncharacterized protein n=1 Tax=Magnaporthiopsis poae (strain ATCC 64411 / 73-15) TaxID=644358 RepID=A0A0C4DUB0_MAGP6|nr:hypothetical protein MAPG_03547 [Magnaporthiopsis poae ATCC 64411]
MQIPDHHVFGRPTIVIRVKRRCSSIKKKITAAIKDIVKQEPGEDVPYNPQNWPQEFDFEELARKEVLKVRRRHYYIAPQGLFDPATESPTTQEILLFSEVPSAAAVLHHQWRQERQQALPTLLSTVSAISIRKVHNLGGEHIGCNIKDQLSVVNNKSRSLANSPVHSDSSDGHTGVDEYDDDPLAHRFCPQNMETLQFDEPQLFLELARGKLLCKLGLDVLPVRPVTESECVPRPRIDGRQLESPFGRQKRLSRGKTGRVPEPWQEGVPRDWQHWWGHHPAPIQGLMELEGRRYWDDNRFYSSPCSTTTEPCPAWLRDTKSADHSVKFRPGLGKFGRLFRPFQQRMRAYSAEDLAAEDADGSTGVVDVDAHSAHIPRPVCSSKLKERLARHQKPLNSSRDRVERLRAENGVVETEAPPTASHPISRPASCPDVQADSSLSFDDLWDKYGSGEKE